jgi:hypothetical protein
MRIGTWNLEGRWSAGHATFMQRCACDIWLLSIVQDAFALEGGETARSEPRGEGDDVSWSAVWSAAGLEAIEPSHPAVACARVGELLVCSSVLPWRNAAPFSDDDGDSVASITRAAIGGVRDALAGGHDVIWGGGWNHGLYEQENVGTLLGRRGIRELVAELTLQTPTARLPNSIAGMFSTDHIAVPERWEVEDASRVIAQLGGRRMTDSDAYVVECEQAVSAAI